MISKLTGRFRIKQNVEISVRDKNGELKKVFQPNKFGSWLLKTSLISPHFQPFFLGKKSDKLINSNVVTITGVAGVASRINGSGAEAAFTYIAVGTGTTAASSTDTTLETELTTSGLARASATASRVTTDVPNDTAKLVASFSVTGTAAVTESGVLNAASGGILLARQVFSAINVVNGDTLEITWRFDVD